jgi:hypothetical protein
LDSSREVRLRQARSYLRNADPVLAQLIDDRPDFDLAEARLDNPFGLMLPTDLFGALLFQITGQQLSIPATRQTLARIEALFGGHLPSATELLGVDPAHLRAAGLSWRKTGTLRDLAGRLSDGRLDPTVLSSLPDDELVAELIAIPGIGPWAVQGALLLLGGKTSSCRATCGCARPSRPPTGWTTSPPSRRSSPSPTNGAPTAAWRPATCSRPPSRRPRHYRPPSARLSAYALSDLTRQPPGALRGGRCERNGAHG